VEPKFKVPERPSMLDAFAEKLSAWLQTEAGRSRKQRRSVKQMHADLLSLGSLHHCAELRTTTLELAPPRGSRQNLIRSGGFKRHTFAGR